MRNLLDNSHFQVKMSVVNGFNRSTGPPTRPIHTENNTLNWTKKQLKKEEEELDKEGETGTERVNEHIPRVENMSWLRTRMNNNNNE